MKKRIIQSTRRIAAKALLGCVRVLDADLVHNKQFRGLWRHRLLSAIRVVDIEKMEALFLLTPLEKMRLRDKFAVSQKCVERLLWTTTNIKELDKLLFGGGLKWEESYENLVVNEGLDHILDVALSGGAQDTSWFVGLLAATPSPAATWTATEIATNDFVNYDEATLQAWTDGGVSGQSVDNSASPAAFTISTNGSSIGGAYLIGTNAKATPAGTLYAAGAFTGGNKAADDGDTLQVTATFTSADDGV